MRQSARDVKVVQLSDAMGKVPDGMARPRRFAVFCLFKKWSVFNVNTPDLLPFRASTSRPRSLRRSREKAYGYHNLP
jgi:hypothetical protein